MTLHTSDAIALVELWAGIKNYIPAKDQKQAAEQFITNIDEAGLVDLSVTGNDLSGVCDIFDKAMRTFLEENGLEIDTDFEEWDE